MIREIRKKMLILSNRMPFSEIAQNCFLDMEKKEWITLNMVLEGSALNSRQINALVSGGYILEASIGDHVMVDRLDSLLAAMSKYSAQKRHLDLALIKAFKNIFDGEEENNNREYRRKNMMMPELDYMAKLPAEIPEAMEALGRYLKERTGIHEGSREGFEAAVKIHNSIIEIMPYDENDKVLARAAMLYFLMCEGYPAVLPELKETDYNELIFRYLKVGSSWPFEEAIIEAILARLELMIQLTDY